MKRSKAYFRGCLLGGAIGDALVYPLRSMDKAALSDALTDGKVTGLICHDAVGRALVSDDTQLMAFTADGMIWADKRAHEKGVYAYIPSVFYGYQKWYYTQTGHFADAEYEFLLNSRILRWEELYARRVENSPALDALRLSTNAKRGTFTNRPNTLGTYGPLVRTSPVSLYFADDTAKAYKIGCQQAALTHGAPEVWYATGFVSAMLSYVVEGQDLEKAAENALRHIRNTEGAENVAAAVRVAVLAATRENVTEEEFYARIDDPEAAVPTLALALFASLRHPDDYAKAVLSAANAKKEPNGASSLTGQLLGAYLGSLEIPYDWIRKVELSDLLVEQADLLLKAQQNK